MGKVRCKSQQNKTSRRDLPYLSWPSVVVGIINIKVFTADLDYWHGRDNIAFLDPSCGKCPSSRLGNPWLHRHNVVDTKSIFFQPFFGSDLVWNIHLCWSFLKRNLRVCKWLRDGVGKSGVARSKECRSNVKKISSSFRGLWSLKVSDRFFKPFINFRVCMLTYKIIVREGRYSLQKPVGVFEIIWQWDEFQVVSLSEIIIPFMTKILWGWNRFGF